MVSSGKKEESSKQRPLRNPKTLRLENEGNNPKPSVWLSLGLKLVFRLRVSQIEDFGLLSLFSIYRVLCLLGVFVFKTLEKKGAAKKSGQRKKKTEKKLE